MDHRIRGHHLAVQLRMTGNQPVEKPAMAVRPVHHGRDRESMKFVFLHFQNR
jgi:hypothetical protein